MPNQNKVGARAAFMLEKVIETYSRADFISRNLAAAKGV